MSSLNKRSQAQEGRIPLPNQWVTSCRMPRWKRPFDIILACVGLILSAPLWGLIALAIKLQDGGPVFYRQERWGWQESTFKVFKFRTMIPDSDTKFGILQARENDERVTRIGRFLRATAMDELPQLLNILRGEMSVVGPRALAVGEVVPDEEGNVLRYEEIPEFRERLTVRPGLTGISAVYQPKDHPPQGKFSYDLRYIRDQSFWLDVKLVILSLWISIRGKWEDRSDKL